MKTVSLNPKLFPLDVVQISCFAFTERAYVVLDGDPAKEIIVHIKPKQGQNADNLGEEFYEELIKYAAYKSINERTAGIRELIVQRALSQSKPSEKQDAAFQDTEQIMVPWEEKHATRNSKR